MKTTWVAVGMMTAATALGGTGIGKYAGEFLSLGVGGRALGMGGAAVALAQDATAGYWNPAGLTALAYPEITLMHDEQFGSLVNYDYGAVALPVAPRATLALSIIRLGVDDIPDTRNAGVDIDGNVTYDPDRFSRIDPQRVTYFSAADWAFLLSYARKESEEFSYGGTVKFIRRELGDDGATGVGFDVGASYRPMDGLILGANAQDVTTTFLSWDTGTNELISPTLKVGAAYLLDALGGRFVPAVDLDFRFENRREASLVHAGPLSADARAGLEYQIADLAAVRVGYTDVGQVTFGAGLRLPRLHVDYSFAKFDGIDQLGNTHRVSLLFTLESEEFRRADLP